MSRHRRNTRSKSLEEDDSTLLETERDLLHGGLLAAFEKLQKQQDERYEDFLRRQDLRFNQRSIVFESMMRRLEELSVRFPLQGAPLLRAQETQDPPPRTPNRERDEPPTHIEELDVDELTYFRSVQDPIHQPRSAPPRQRDTLRGHHLARPPDRREPCLRQGRVFVGKVEEEDEFVEPQPMEIEEVVDCSIKAFTHNDVPDVMQIGTINLESSSHVILEILIDGLSTALICRLPRFEFQEFCVFHATISLWDPGGFCKPYPPSLEDKRNSRGVE